MADTTHEADELTQISGALESLSAPITLRTENDFMRAGVQAMNLLLALGKLSVSLPRPTGRGYTKRHAPIVGLIVRMVKLYEGYLDQMVSRRRELMWVYMRPLYEAHIKMEYLIRSGRQSAKSFIEASFRADKEILAHLNNLKAKRPLVPIERRMRDSIVRRLQQAGITQKRLFTFKQWEIDGKNMRDLLKHLNRDLHYAFAFGNSSHAVHGTWHDLWTNHLSKDAKGFHADVTFGTPEPRHLGPPSVILGKSLIMFLCHFRIDRSNRVMPSITGAVNYFHHLNAAWERQLAGSDAASR